MLISKARNFIAASGSCFTICLILSLFVIQPNRVLGQEESALGKPSRTDRIVARLVAELMQKGHLSKRQLDDTISQRAFDGFIKGLDPMKTYFLKSDIEEFSKYRTEIDNQMLQMDYSAAFAIFKRFLERVDERVVLATELVDENHDYSVDEEMVTDPDLLDYPSNEAEARESWRKRIKYSLLVLKGDESEKAEDPEKKSAKKEDPKDILRRRYTSFARRMHQMDNEDVVERYISAITNSYDPHTSYLSKGSFENFLISMSLELDGIGATLQGSDEGYTVIKSIVKGGAAFKQGELKVEDKIVAVGQGNEDGSDADMRLMRQHGPEFIDVIGMKLDDVVGMIRGKAGTTVRLSVMSESDSELHTVKIVREKIKLEESAAHGAIFEEGKKADGTPNKIGVIELPSFYSAMDGDGVGGRSTTTDVLKILNEFNEKDVDALVLDLRANGGGSLKEAIDCTGLFIDLGPVVQVKNSMGSIEELNDENSGMAWKKPMVVLTSKFSASASEILAGAVQDYERGLVVGDTSTHGKGTVQSLMNISRMVYNIPNPPNDYGALKITTQQFYRPNGDSTQKRGVLSDIVLPSITDKMDVGESDLDYPVEFDKVPRASYNAYSMTRPEFVKAIQQRSSDRLSKSEKFQKETDKIAKYVEQKNLKSVSLNEEKFLARRRELNADKENEKALESQLVPDDEIKRNYYLDEVLRITVDYMELLAKNS